MRTVTAVAATMTAFSAHAELVDQATAVDAVTVTARTLEHPYADALAPYKTDSSASGKFTQPLLDVSKSVVVIPRQVIDDSGATSFRDLMRTQSGVTLGTGEGGNAFGDRIFIRGFDARNDVYIDGVRDPGVGARETFAVEQVEILKGPSSTFGGRGTTGGAVSLISKRPAQGNFGEIEATLGTDATKRLALDLNRRLTDKLTVRLNVMGHKSDVSERNDVFNNRWGVALAANYRATDKLTLSADYFHLTTDEMPDWGVPYDLANNRPFQVKRDNFYGITARDFRKTFSDIYTAKAAYEASDNLSFSTLFRYGDTANQYTASAPEQPDAVAGTVRANAKRRDAITDYYVNQTDATFKFNTGLVRHTLVGGFEISREEILNRGRAFTECATLPCTGTAANPVQNLANPDPNRPWTVTDGGITSRTNTRVESKSFYFLDTARLGSHWEIFGGARYDDYDIDFRQLAIATGVLTHRASQSSFWNWHAGITYKPVSFGSIYVSYGSSSNPSGEQLDATALDYGGLDVRTINLDPERNKAYELGTKWNLFDGHLNLTGALFRIDKVNARVAVGAGAGAAVVLTGQQRVQGFELTASGSITPQWSVFGGLTVLDAKITGSPTVAQIGAKFPNIPDVSFNLSSRYQLTSKAHVGATATYNGKRYGGTVAALATSIPEFWRVDLFGGYQFNDRIEVSFNVLNLTNELYYDALYRSATPF
ncbi:MAG: TonB-dependent siderophore receptor, partial [Caulobacteraceae bacterium]